MNDEFPRSKGHGHKVTRRCGSKMSHSSVTDGLIAYVSNDSAFSVLGQIDQECREIQGGNREIVVDYCV